MKRLSSTLAGILALSFAAGVAVPVNAAPVFAPSAPIVSADVQQVQHRRDNRRDRFERRGNHTYYNGRRGYRERRPGYRQHNGFWFPPAAFIAGAIIGGALNNQPAVRGDSRHVRWCENRWRSYRASDNSYQPYNGPRQRCVSPYS